MKCYFVQIQDGNVILGGIARTKGATVSDNSFAGPTVARKTSPSAACQAISLGTVMRHQLLSFPATGLGLTPSFHLGS